MDENTKYFIVETSDDTKSLLKNHKIAGIDEKFNDDFLALFDEKDELIMFINKNIITSIRLED